MRTARYRFAIVFASSALALLAIAAPALADNPTEKDGYGVAAFDGLITAGPIPEIEPGPETLDLPEPANPADPVNFPADFTQAGGHPYEAFTVFDFNRYTHPTFGANWPEEPPKDIVVDLPPGLIGNPQGIPQCDLAELASFECPVGAQVGTLNVFDSHLSAFFFQDVGLYRMRTPSGIPARFSANLVGSIVNIDAKLRSDGDYGVSLGSFNTSEGVALGEVKVSLWGVPADPRHDPYRRCTGPDIGGNFQSCPTDQPERALITLPTACPTPGQGLTTTLRTDSWFHFGEFKQATFVSHRAPGWYGSLNRFAPAEYPISVTPDKWGAPQGPTGCEELLFEPKANMTPTANSAETTSGLSAEIAMPVEGYSSPDLLAQSAIEKTVVTLPQGVTVNPSSAEGLAACTPAQLKAETLNSPLGAGCPAEAKIGSVQVESPLTANKVEGSLFIAQQDDPATSQPGAENPFDSLLAMYIVAKSPEEGILLKLPGKVTPDPSTGQLVTSFDDLPQLPFSKFTLRFREGQRGILVTPPACGTFQTKTEFTPYSDPSQVKTVLSPFTVTRGVGGGACPSGGLPPFKPGLDAGTLNNAAGRYSPFNLRLTRNDGEQEFTNFSIKLPPGLVGKLAGIPFCSDAAIAASKNPNRSGATELANPSCPKASEVGRTLVGAGVGPALTYVPGKVYLAGPYHGSSLSIAAITAAKVGPFDLGTVVVREALKINPETAEVFIDATGSDPIPHIIDGIVVHARDIRVYVDRSQFVLNPTSCERTSTASTLLGSGLDFASTIDDNPITVTSPFQAADCGALGFKPRLSLSLSGGTKRGDNPRFKAVLTARPGDANIGAAQVTLPHSAFLDQSHIKTICTRVQFAAGAGNGAGCPAASIYGYAKAETPLLDEPLQGPVFLRSSSHNLPDLLVALHSGKIDINLAGRIDSVGDGQIRNTFEEVPDAPVTRFTLTMQGAKKSLLVNSANLCARRNRATVAFTGQNGKVHKLKPVLKAQCGKQAKAKNKKKR